MVWAVLPAARSDPATNRFTNPPTPVCRTSPSDEPNVLTDCEFAPITSGTVYANETAIAVNPKRPSNVLAVADDNQILLTPSRELQYTLPRVRVSDDGGRSWISYAPPWGKRDVNDSEVAFDARGTAYVSALSRPRGSDGDLDIVVARSGDGGRRWSRPVPIARGSGNDTEGVENDQDALAAWGDGNAIVAWAQYHLNRGYRGSPILASVTRDGGRTWTPPQVISGSAPFCVGISGDQACDQAQDAQPVVTEDGHLLVSFVASDKAGVASTIEPNKLMVVELDPASGAPISGPFLIAQVSDGASQYPVNALGLPTLHDSQFIVSSLGGIAADPKDSAHLAQVWSDMRNSPLSAPQDPYGATTNSDVVVAQSYDRGRTWSAPLAIPLAGDQFEPSTVYDTAGRLRISFFDRAYDPDNDRYGYTLATERRSGSLEFELQQASTALSNPTRDDHLQARDTVNPSFPHPTLTIGDHGAIARTPTGVITSWTDLRGIVCFGGRCGAGQNAYVARLP